MCRGELHAREEGAKGEEGAEEATTFCYVVVLLVIYWSRNTASPAASDGQRGLFVAVVISGPF